MPSGYGVVFPSMAADFKFSFDQLLVRFVKDTALRLLPSMEVFINRRTFEQSKPFYDR
jgi:hypothetical protein